MAYSYLNIIVFITATYAYYLLLKPRLTYDKLNDQEAYSKYLTDNYAFLAVYLLVTIILQIMLNINVINEKCGGSVSDNMGYAGIVTIVPWTLIFGVLIVILTIYPGFKSAFSDVIGYYWVSNTANTLVNDLLIDKEIETNVKDMPENEKKTMSETAYAIKEICGNTSVLINQMTPSNFYKFWNILTPLMKPEYKEGGAKFNELPKKRDQLFELVMTKDNIGESLWYIYTGLLVTSVVQLNIYTRGCIRNPKTMEEDYQKFTDLQKTANEKVESGAADPNNITKNIPTL
jgi:hypothetical protein